MDPRHESITAGYKSVSELKLLGKGLAHLSHDRPTPSIFLTTSMQNYPQFAAQPQAHADASSDSSTALIHQFFNQNLGTDPRPSAFGLQGPPPARSLGQTGRPNNRIPYNKLGKYADYGCSGFLYSSSTSGIQTDMARMRIITRRNAPNKLLPFSRIVLSELKRGIRDKVRPTESSISRIPWVVKLFTTFQDAYLLYMLMEFLPGGDLMTMLMKYEIFSEDITRFHMAECILAVEAVHKLGFIHRDIKPDDILLDRGGRIKLTDFGLSTGFSRLHDNSYYQHLLQGKSDKSKDRSSLAIDQINLTVSNRSQINKWRQSRRLIAYSTVGTPDYIAPEISTGHDYSFSCDSWSLGTIILICNPENRISRSGAEELKAHPFVRREFDGLRRVRAPFEPRLTCDMDTTYFPTDEIDQTDIASRLEAQARETPLQGFTRDEPAFIGYTFKRFDANLR
ncbi:Serine/threonine-protein kinase [Metarhizium rileyi]|uniref:non-specific serine/threonine protein kinase n=1 Tax=Metarhizium rileyi (strain RCEF 4871) TaxID=1649241 RepID=A0A5C6GGZ1_METRR|nr:Serine/threonine-protein kinase [Metarhizium rileyi]